MCDVFCQTIYLFTWPFPCACVFTCFRKRTMRFSDSSRFNSIRSFYLQFFCLFIYIYIFFFLALASQAMPNTAQAVSRLFTWRQNKFFSVHIREGTIDDVAVTIYVLTKHAPLIGKQLSIVVCNPSVPFFFINLTFPLRFDLPTPCTHFTIVSVFSAEYTGCVQKHGIGRVKTCPYSTVPHVTKTRIADH